MGMPEISGSQANKYATHNEALRYVDGNIHTVAQSRTVFSAPASTVALPGGMWVVPASSLTAGTPWSTHESDVAHFYASTWYFYTPFDGMKFRVLDEGTTGLDYVYISGTGWTKDFLSQGFLVSDIFTAPGQLFYSNATALATTLGPGTAGQTLMTDGSAIFWSVASGAGNVIGPTSATKYMIPVYASTNGKIITSSMWAIANSSTMESGGRFDGKNNLIASTQIQGYRETVVSVVASAGGPSVNIDLSLANVFDLYLAANASVQFVNALAGAGKATPVTMRIRQDATGGRTVSYINTMLWTYGSVIAVTASANAIDLNTYITFNSSTFMAMVAAKDIK